MLSLKSLAILMRRITSIQVIYKKSHDARLINFNPNLITDKWKQTDQQKQKEIILI